MMRRWIGIKYARILTVAPLIELVEAIRGAKDVASPQKQVSTDNINGEVVHRVDLDMFAIDSVHLLRVHLGVSIRGKNGHWPPLQGLVLDLLCPHRV